MLVLSENGTKKKIGRSNKLTRSSPLSRNKIPLSPCKPSWTKGPTVRCRTAKWIVYDTKQNKCKNETVAKIGQNHHTWEQKLAELHRGT